MTTSISASNRNLRKPTRCHGWVKSPRQGSGRAAWPLVTAAAAAPVLLLHAGKGLQHLYSGESRLGLKMRTYPNHGNATLPAFPSAAGAQCTPVASPRLKAT